MSPPIARPFPRFMADTPQDARPYGEWQERLSEAFASACEPLAADAGAPLDPESLRFFPERTWGRRIYVPVIGEASEQAEEETEYYGHLHFDLGPDGEPGDFVAEVDFTDVTAADNPDWAIDLNDAVIGDWRADGGRGGEVTLVWGTPLVRGAIAATAELGSEILDQTAVNDGRFTLLAVDAVHGFGDELFLEIKLWDRRLNQVAAESLYDEAEPEPEAEADEPAEAASGERD